MFLRGRANLQMLDVEQMDRGDSPLSISAKIKLIVLVVEKKNTS